MMNANEIEYQFGGREKLDDIRKLWEQLNNHHATVSKHFKDEFQLNRFEKRKASLLKKSTAENLRVDIAFSKRYARPIAYCISIVDAKKVGEMESIFVEPKFRGKGVANDLMKAALKWLD